MVLAIWLYCTGKWGGQGRESVKQTNKAQTSYGCFAPRMIWLFLSLGFMRLIMSQIKVSDRRGLSPSFSFSFIRTEPNPGWLCLHEMLSSLLVRLVMNPFWRSGDSMQVTSRFIPGGCADSRLDCVQCLSGYAQINLMILSGCKPACLTASPQLSGIQAGDILT